MNSMFDAVVGEAFPLFIIYLEGCKSRKSAWMKSSTSNYTKNPGREGFRTACLAGNKSQQYRELYAESSVDLDDGN